MRFTGYHEVCLYGNVPICIESILENAHYRFLWEYKIFTSTFPHAEPQPRPVTYHFPIWSRSYLEFSIKEVSSGSPTQHQVTPLVERKIHIELLILITTDWTTPIRRIYRETFCFPVQIFVGDKSASATNGSRWHSPLQMSPLERHHSPFDEARYSSWPKTKTGWKYSVQCCAVHFHRSMTTRRFHSASLLGETHFGELHRRLFPPAWVRSQRLR